jgi:uncharacterized peroxidase-related enzyme
MPHIAISEGLVGLRSLMHFRPETAAPLQALAEVLLRGPSALSRGERELIASFVSTRNECLFCASSHSAFAAAQVEGGRAIVDAVCADYRTAPISDKLKALLAIADEVQVGGKKVTDALITAARVAGATDIEIHDAVLISAAFCMYNRYVDGLAAVTPTDPAAYERIAADVVANGYLRPLQPGR